MYKLNMNLIKYNYLHQYNDLYIKIIYFKKQNIFDNDITNKLIISLLSPIYTIYFKNYYLLKLFIDSGGNINKSYKLYNNKTLFYLCCEIGFYAGAKLLLKYDVNINIIINYIYTPLIISCQNNFINIINLLINNKQINLNLKLYNNFTQVEAIIHNCILYIINKSNYPIYNKNINFKKKIIKILENKYTNFNSETIKLLIKYNNDLELF